MLANKFKKSFLCNIFNKTLHFHQFSLTGDNNSIINGRMMIEKVSFSLTLSKVTSRLFFFYQVINQEQQRRSLLGTRWGSFLTSRSFSSSNPLKIKIISLWDWRSGWIRAFFHHFQNQTRIVFMDGLTKRKPTPDNHALPLSLHSIIMALNFPWSIQFLYPCFMLL